ncbi:MAG: hypothetical protein MUP19_00475 [Candidatus Aminicenantes bacterium]|nr:hypothetical protein [Candidatus Aminicenantes bacterium]
MPLRTAAAAVLGIFALASFPLGTARSDQVPAPRWSVELVLSVAGTYRITDETGPTTGDYSFTVRWKGSLERDDVDWRLTHGTCELADWKAEERPALQSLGWALTTEDFGDKPAFRFHYVLQDKGRIELDFGMDGFSIPLHPSREKFPLILPASARTTRPGPGLKYDHFVITGSNLIQFDESEFMDAPLEKTFAWSWRRYQSALEQNLTIHCYQSHKVRLAVSFQPA